MKKNILLGFDDKLFLQILNYRLKKRNFNTIPATSLSDSLYQIESGKTVPDVIVFSASCKDMDINDAVDELQKKLLNKPIPIIIVNFDATQLQDITALGVHILRGPFFSFDQLCQKIDTLSTTESHYMDSNAVINNKILLVEDDPETRKMLKDDLIDAQFEVIEAKNGIEGLNHFNKTNPNMIITDIIMPDMDGIKMTKEIRKVNDTLPILVITGYPEKISHSIEAGANKGLSKPINRESFMKTISHFTGKK